MPERCASCGRFSTGPFVDNSAGDVLEPPAWVAPCCQSPADLARHVAESGGVGEGSDA